MKIIHTSDWHIGKIIHGHTILEDQEYILHQILEIVGKIKPDAFLICGDVFDKSIVTVESMILFDTFLNELILRHEIPTIITSGNHDNPGRLKIGAEIFKNKKLYIQTELSDIFSPIEITDTHNTIKIYTLPYYDIPYFNTFLSNTYDSFTSSIEDLINKLIDTSPIPEGSILMTHYTMKGKSIRSDSERLLTIGGVEEVDPQIFAPFTYVALGHFHSAQSIKSGRNHIQYSGSILQYSFDEPKDKSLTLLEINKDQSVNISKIPLSPKRPLRVLKGTFDTIISESTKDENKQDYLEIQLVDKNIIPNPMERLKKIYPNILTVSQLSLIQDSEKTNLTVDTTQLDHSPLHIIDAFYEEILNESLPEKEKQVLQQSLQKLELE